MGKRQREKNARRVLEGLDTALKDTADKREAILAKAKAKAGAALRAKPAATAPSGPRSGNPASSVSSGGVETVWEAVIPCDGISIRRQWDYDEGKDGKYTCAQCGAKPCRSWFRIEETDLEGNLQVGNDKEGYLYGRCYECCRGRGTVEGPGDIYKGLAPDHDEEMLQ